MAGARRQEEGIGRQVARWFLPAVICGVLLLAIPYTRNILLWVDQGGNVLLGGDPRETISSACGKVRAGEYHAPVQRFAVCWWACPLLNVADAGHCEAARDGNVGDRRVSP